MLPEPAAHGSMSLRWTLMLRRSRDVLQADLSDRATAIALIKDADCVAHIASFPRPVGYAPRSVRTNMTLMFNVLTAMERHRYRSSYAPRPSVFCLRCDPLQFASITCH